MTIADTVFETINDNWGSGGYGGAAPAIDTTETQTAHDETTTDVVEVRHYTLRETGDQRNDNYVDRHYSLDVYISSKTSNAQLKLLYDEVEYLLRNTAMTGLQLEAIDKDWNVSQWEQGRHSVVLRVRVLAPLSDGAVTSAAGVTASMQALLMYGSANAAWQPCVFELNTNVGKVNSTGSAITNIDGTDTTLSLILPLPTVKGSLKLYVSGCRIGIADADAGDYVTQTLIRGEVFGSRTTLDQNDTDYTSAQRAEKTFTAVDCSSYDKIFVELYLTCTDAGDIDIAFLNLQCYYA